MNKPPAKRPSGRPTVAKSGEIMKSRPLRMTDAEWQKCKDLGGAAWVRKMIDKAKLPPKP